MTPVKEVLYIVCNNLLRNINKSKFIRSVYLSNRSFSKFSAAFLYEPLRNKFSYINEWYEYFNGFKEMQIAQEKVFAAGERLEILQEERRKAWADLTEIQKKLKENYSLLENTKKGDERYLDLIKSEFNLLREEKTLEENYRKIDVSERDQFNRYTTAIKNSHEVERIQSERKKYFTLIASLVGAIMGVIGTTINHYFKMSEINLVLSKLSGDYISDQLENQLKIIKNLTLAFSEFEKNNDTVYMSRLYKKLHKKLASLENLVKKAEYKNLRNRKSKHANSDSDYFSIFSKGEYKNVIYVLSGGVICVVGVIVIGKIFQ